MSASGCNVSFLRKSFLDWLKGEHSQDKMRHPRFAVVAGIDHLHDRLFGIIPDSPCRDYQVGIIQDLMMLGAQVLCLKVGNGCIVNDCSILRVCSCFRCHVDSNDFDRILDVLLVKYLSVPFDEFSRDNLCKSATSLRSGPESCGRDRLCPIAQSSRLLEAGHQASLRATIPRLSARGPCCPQRTVQRP